jgi:hypothetical protein
MIHAHAQTSENETAKMGAIQGQAQVNGPQVVYHLHRRTKEAISEGKIHLSVKQGPNSEKYSILLCAVKSSFKTGLHRPNPKSLTGG